MSLPKEKMVEKNYNLLYGGQAPLPIVNAFGDKKPRQ
jgi:hypothetical protein